jgi:heptose-I-phosphate ethanolaminephosphotransferase
MNRFYPRIKKMLPNLATLYLLLLISGSFVFVLQIQEPEGIDFVNTLLSVIFSNFIAAVLVSYVISFLSERCAGRVMIVLICVMSFITVIDGILAFKYRMVFTAEVLNAVLGTNSNEANGVISDILTFGNVALMLLCLAGLILGSIFLRSKLSRRCGTATVRGKGLLVALACAALLFSLALPVRYAVMFVNKESDMKMILYIFSDQPGRILYAVFRSYKYERAVSSYINDNLNYLNSPAKISVPADSMNCVVILGESYSKYHSSLYGYGRPTCHELERMRSEGNLAVFTDVVSADDVTQKVIMSLFNFYGSNSKVLLPAVLKKGGYTCFAYDNEFVVSNGAQWWLISQKLSSALFSRRNTELMQYDGQLTSTINVAKCRHAFYFVHLFGQHFIYDDRYPSNFRKFQPQSYPNHYGAAQQKSLSGYDNATLYNDYVVSSVIRKFSMTNAVVIYLPDHGEEIYDIRDYAGHSSMTNCKASAKYQCEIPFMIWMSDKFISKNPDIAKRVFAAVNRPFISTKLSDTMLDLLNINCPLSDRRNSVISPQYDSKTPRIILNDLNYDKIKANGFK